MKDKYTKQIQRLRRNPSLINNEWANRIGLFDMCWYPRRWKGKDAGCLTMIKGLDYNAETPELTAAIRNDKNIPICLDNIKLKHLPTFAKWQRRLDKELNRPL